MIKFNELKSEDLFKDVNEETFNIYLKNMWTKKYKKGQVIYFEKDKAKTLDIILMGQVEVTGYSEDGRYISIDTFSKGDILGGALLFSQNPEYPMTVISKSEVILLKMNKDTIIMFSMKDKYFLLNLLSMFSKKTAILSNRIRTVSLKTIKESVMDFLLKEISIQKTNKVKLNISKKELAKKFGVKRTSLSRELAKMRDDGVINYDANSITLLKPYFDESIL